MRNPLGPIGALRIIDAESVGDPYEDWSQVRSPGRAARRRRLGHPQRIVIRYRANGKAIHDTVRGVICLHPHDRVVFDQMMRGAGR
jgi:hypothetical protein